MAGGVLAGQFGAAKRLVIALQPTEIQTECLGAVGLRAGGGRRARNGRGGPGPRVLTERQDLVPDGLAAGAGLAHDGRASLGRRTPGTETAVLVRAVWHPSLIGRGTGFHTHKQ